MTDLDATAMDAEDATRHARLAAVTLAAAALWYGQQGLRVFPLQPLSKIPYKGTRGCHDATNNQRQIVAWWEARPESNIGIATGHLVDVIDVDGLPGNLSILGTLDTLPPILGKVSTPRPGGRHLYIPATGRGNKAGIFPSVDYRGVGGYVVAPPSRTGQGPYVWYVPLVLP